MLGGCLGPLVTRLGVAWAHRQLTSSKKRVVWRREEEEKERKEKKEKRRRRKRKKKSKRKREREKGEKKKCLGGEVRVFKF